VQLDLPGGNRLHVINVHLKSKIPTNIPGQKIDGYTWRSANAWAEGSFISSMKRMSQALQVRRLVDQILDTDPAAQIVVAGDFNAAPGCLSPQLRIVGELLPFATNGTQDSAVAGLGSLSRNDDPCLAAQPVRPRTRTATNRQCSRRRGFSGLTSVYGKSPVGRQGIRLNGCVARTLRCGAPMDSSQKVDGPQRQRPGSQAVGQSNTDPLPGSSGPRVRRERIGRIT
jgi:hypothetical protein